MRASSTVLVSIVALAGLGGCAFIAEHSTPAKHAAGIRSPAALKADDLFWSTLHAGAYDDIAAALEAETAAYLEDPTDAVTASHVGWLHIWRLSERARLAATPATLTDDATLARRYFQEAVTLDPADARYRGFLAASMLAEAQIHHDERQTRRGYYRLRAAIDAWPEFNLFTAGYVLSTQPSDTPRFREALDWQWKNLDACVGATVDRHTGAYDAYLSLETHAGPKRVCWNSNIAPHNFEGFFLNLGDLLVKSGDWQTARRAYANARLSTTYAAWPYRDVLETRIRDAERNVATFNAAGAIPAADKRLMIESRFACTACHQR